MTSVNFYDKEQTDDLLDTKADKSTTYTKTEMDTALGTKANANDVYTKAQVDTALNGKANASDVYTKAQVDTALNTKANKKTVRVFDNISDALTALAGVSDFAVISLNYTMANGDILVDGIYTKYPEVSQLIGGCIRAIINGNTYRVCNNIYLTATTIEVRGLDTLSTFVAETLSASTNFTAFEMRIVESN